MALILKLQSRGFQRRRQRRLLALVLSCVLSFYILWPTFLVVRASFEDKQNQQLIDTSRIGRVFIAANHYDSERVLEAYWIPAVLALIRALGRENVFVSIAASKSSDNTLSVLAHFDQLLGSMGVNRRIQLEEETHEKLVAHRPEEGDKGWVITPVGNHQWRRIPFLAGVRNRVLEPLADSQVVNATSGFDKVLFLNDIVFTAHDALTLLDTRGGRYAAACALDFLPNRMFYDIFVMRDSKHRRVANQARYPYFGTGPSRDALVRGHPTPVSSCWNGMTAFDAKPFLSPEKPLRFRAVDDTLAQRHVEASECCLIHVDNPESQRRGVWVNPHVRVAYHEDAYLRMRSWPTSKDRLLGAWLNLRNDITGMPWPKTWITRAVKEWLAEDPTRKGSEPGLFCLEDQMQILTPQSWQTVKKPRPKAGGRLQWKQDP